MRFATTLFALALFAGVTLAADATVEVGVVDQKPPKAKELTAPKKDDGLTTVDMRTAVKGKVPKGDKRAVYVLINPLGKGNTPTYWWVQNEVTRDGETISCDAQFGEEDAGSGEYFAVVVVTTERKWAVGDKLDDLPEDAKCSQVKVVKRK
jgi:hypothetical protein